MLLKNKAAVIYGVGGIGGAVAREFASEGATVFITGPQWWPVEQVAREILATGGYAEPSVVDALDEEAVDAHLESVIRYLGHLDISFNALAITDETLSGDLPTRIDVGQCSVPSTADTTSSFLTARLAARYMIANKSGVIITATGLPVRKGSPPNGGYGPAHAAQKVMRDLSYELAPHGVRVVSLRLDRSPEIATAAKAFDIEERPNGMMRKQFLGHLASTTQPKRVITLEEVGAVAAFVASDRSIDLTGTTVDMTVGTIDG